MANEHDPDRAKAPSVGDIRQMWRQQSRQDQAMSVEEVRAFQESAAAVRDVARSVGL